MGDGQVGRTSTAPAAGNSDSAPSGEVTSSRKRHKVFAGANVSGDEEIARGRWGSAAATSASQFDADDSVGGRARAVPGYRAATW
jgi:hypothetical protein